MTAQSHIVSDDITVVDVNLTDYRKETRNGR
jgi:hypothetical protein